jgi:hypothetical protein
VAGTPIVTKDITPQRPFRQPSAPVLLVASDAIMMSEAKDVSGPSQKHSGSAESYIY